MLIYLKARIRLPTLQADPTANSQSLSITIRLIQCDWSIIGQQSELACDPSALWINLEKINPENTWITNKMVVGAVGFMCPNAW